MALSGKKISVIIPALNEEASIGKVLTDLPDYIDRVIVCDNGSTDKTKEVARDGGAIVVEESEKGYGAACLRAATAVDDDTEVLLFIDGDYSDYPEEADKILRPIVDDGYDFVVGSRMATRKENNALQPAAVFGNWLTSNLIKLFWGIKFTDIGPFRAIRYAAYRNLKMQDRNFGWTVEMQVRAVKQGLSCLEVPVSYRSRIGKSKISGTIYGSVRAGSKFLWIVLRELLHR